MSKTARILDIDPPYGIPGGEVVIECEHFDTSDAGICSVSFDEMVAPIVALSSRRVLAIVPEVPGGGSVQVRLNVGDQQSPAFNFTVAKKLISEVHPVSNPAFDPDDGALFVTRSGSRGEELPVTLFRVDPNGDVTEHSGDISNPTGIAFNSDGEMYVSSRLDGNVYKITPFRDAVVFARNLGVATGVAFDRNGVMHVGDRSGTIFRVNGIGEEKSWVELEPSVSAYHLAFGPDDALYVTGPTVTSFDCIWRVNPDGEVDIFFKGLGRPQGLAFDTDGNLYVTASIRGRRGVVRISRDGKDARIVVSGVNLVGLAFSPTGEMAVASIDSVYSLPMKIYGTLLSR